MIMVRSSWFTFSCKCFSMIILTCTIKCIMQLVLQDFICSEWFWFRWQLADLITEKLACTPEQLQWRKSLLASALRWLVTAYKEHKKPLKNEETMLKRLKTLLVCIEHVFVHVSMLFTQFANAKYQVPFSCSCSVLFK